MCIHTNRSSVLWAMNVLYLITNTDPCNASLNGNWTSILMLICLASQHCALSTIFHEFFLERIILINQPIVTLLKDQKFILSIFKGKWPLLNFFDSEHMPVPVKHKKAVVSVFVCPPSLTPLIRVQYI